MTKEQSQLVTQRIRTLENNSSLLENKVESMNNE